MARRKLAQCQVQSVLGDVECGTIGGWCCAGGRPDRRAVDGHLRVERLAECAVLVRSAFRGLGSAVGRCGQELRGNTNPGSCDTYQNLIRITWVERSDGVSIICQLPIKDIRCWLSCV